MADKILILSIGHAHAWAPCPWPGLQLAAPNSMAASAVLQLTWSIRLRGRTCGPVAIHAMASFIPTRGTLVAIDEDRGEP
jgi:hypothetical protein